MLRHCFVISFRSISFCSPSSSSTRGSLVASVVDDESIRERPYNDALPTPEEWDLEYDPVRLISKR